MDPVTASVVDELRSREPIFHRREHATTRAELEAMIAPDYWEVGASGAVYDRATVLDVVEQRYEDPAYDPLAGMEVSDFACRRAGEGVWLATYALRQGTRRSRRLTVWHRVEGRWMALYHQGTLAP